MNFDASVLDSLIGRKPVLLVAGVRFIRSAFDGARCTSLLMPFLLLKQELNVAYSLLLFLLLALTSVPKVTTMTKSLRMANPYMLAAQQWAILSKEHSELDESRDSYLLLLPPTPTENLQMSDSEEVSDDSDEASNLSSPRRSKENSRKKERKGNDVSECSRAKRRKTEAKGVILHNNDVILGEGFDDHEGNIKFRAFCNKKRKAFTKASRYVGNSVLLL